jgi:outer membrane protein OmpA-like peptidoglycan-associated protein
MGATEEIEDQKDKEGDREEDKLLLAKPLNESAPRPLQRQVRMEEKEIGSLQAESTESLRSSFEAGDKVESRVSQSKGGGSPLPDSVRSYMEPRFGVDFSHVRAHTGSDAIQMNQAIGAQAFTHGSDIYYGADNSPTNLELTAHELTHVIQQTGSLQRYHETMPVLGMGSGAGPSSVTIDPLWGQVKPTTALGAGIPTVLPFATNLETVNLDDDVIAGTVLINMVETANINNIVLNDTQFATWHGTIPFTVSGEQVNFSAPIVSLESGGTGAILSVNVGSGVTPGGGYATIGVSVVASGSQTIGGGIGVGPVSGSAPVQSTANFAGGITRTFTVNLRPQPPRPITAPDISFQIGSAQLTEGQEGVISSWFEGLPASAKEAIRNGRRSISISGYASTTGRRSRNRGLSENRAHVVERILRGHVGSNASLNIFFFGEDNATTPDEAEDPRWRRVTMVVQAPSRTAPGVPGPSPSTPPP